MFDSGGVQGLCDGYSCASHELKLFPNVELGPSQVPDRASTNHHAASMNLGRDPLAVVDTLR
jgi:hypothetical protein